MFPRLIIAEDPEMSVVKIIELVGSYQHWEDATKNAFAEAAKTIKNIKSIYVKRVNTKVENNKIVEYRVNVKIAFIVKEKNESILVDFCIFHLFR